MSKIFLAFLSALCLALPAIAHAEDNGLYAPVAPEGSAFYRFIDANPSISDVIPQADGKKFKALNFKSVTFYHVTPERKVNFSFGGKTISQPLAAKKFYSIILDKDGVYIIEDKSLTFKAKALLCFYNLTHEKKLTLKLADHSVNVINGVAPRKNGAREINPVKLPLSAFNEQDQKIATLDAIQVERGTSYSILAFENKKGDVELQYNSAEIDTNP